MLPDELLTALIHIRKRPLDGLAHVHAAALLIITKTRGREDAFFGFGSGSPRDAGQPPGRSGSDRLQLVSFEGLGQELLGINS